MTDFEAATRTSYDVLSVDHLDLVSTDLAPRPLDRGMIAAFASYVLGTGNPRVVDIGCGAGRVTPTLANSGLAPEGIDLSPAMIARARTDNPGLTFRVGSMLALDLADGALGGVFAWYSIIHVPRRDRVRALAEFRRVLTPGGVLLLAFQVGDETKHYADVDGRAVDLTFYRQRPDDLAGLLRGLGFRELGRLVRAPLAEVERHPQGILIARR